MIEHIKLFPSFFWEKKTINLLVPISIVQHEQRKSMKAELLSLVAKEEIYWRQKCKHGWIEEGDANTSFFHRTLASRKRKNTILEILSTSGNSLLIEDHRFTGFFENLYTIKDNQFPSNIDWNPIDPHQTLAMVAEFTETEAWHAIQLIGNEKSPAQTVSHLNSLKKARTSSRAT